MNCFASDTGGLIFGNRFGVKKFCKSISPGKTWLGVIGSILGAQIYAIGNLYIGKLGNFSWAPYQLTLGETVTLSLVSSVICILGDLFESLIKRSAAEKDSGNFFPGHGGMLDRLDSLLFSIPLLNYYIKTFILHKYLVKI
jgi:phosphatidate cytidylyltransferase